MNNNQIIHAYSIKEVSKMLNIPTGIIRQWEKELKGLFVIPRTQQGARYFRDHEIEILNKMKELRSQNISKGTMRSLIEEYLNSEKNKRVTKPNAVIMEASDVPPQKLAVETIKENDEKQPNNVEALYTAIADFKQDLLTEFKYELQMSKTDMIDEIKSEVSDSTLITVKEISKSIQRSNDKQRSNIHEISNMIMKASEHTTETFETLSEKIQKNSETAYERFSEQITETTKLADRRNHKAIERVANTLKETKEDVASLSKAFDTKQETILESLYELKQSQSEIKKREEQFQSMIESYRQVASAKQNRKWWKLWS